MTILMKRAVAALVIVLGLVVFAASISSEEKESAYRYDKKVYLNGVSVCEDEEGVFVTNKERDEITLYAASEGFPWGWVEWELQLRDVEVVKRYKVTRCCSWPANEEGCSESLIWSSKYDSPQEAP